MNAADKLALAGAGCAIAAVTAAANAFIFPHDAGVIMLAVFLPLVVASVAAFLTAAVLQLHIR